MKKKIIRGCEARGDKDSPYLTRWEWVFKTFAIYLHKFHRSDDRSSLHGHPWNFITLVLWRGYNDCTYNGGTDAQGEPTYNRQRLYPGMIAYRKATHVHFVELINEKPAWTLVIRFNYLRWWGFWKDGRFTLFSDYFRENGC